MIAAFSGQLSAMLSAYAKHNKRRASVRVQHCYDSNNLLPTNVDRCYPDEEAQPKDEEEIVTVFKSHADILYAERLPDKTAVITMLRDPAALVESRYMYQYRNAEPNPPPLAEWVCSLHISTRLTEFFALLQPLTESQTTA